MSAQEDKARTAKLSKPTTSTNLNQVDVGAGRQSTHCWASSPLRWQPEHARERTLERSPSDAGWRRDGYGLSLTRMSSLNRICSPMCSLRLLLEWFLLLECVLLLECALLVDCGLVLECVLLLECVLFACRLKTRWWRTCRRRHLSSASSTSTFRPTSLSPWRRCIVYYIVYCILHTCIHAYIRIYIYRCIYI